MNTLNNDHVDDEQPDCINEPLLKKPGFIGTADEYIPELLDNKFILTGYRCNYGSHYDVFMTLFKWHNETMNAWSHLIGAILAFVIIVIILCSCPNMMNDATSLEKQFNQACAAGKGIIFIEEQTKLLEGHIDAVKEIEEKAGDAILQDDYKEDLEYKLVDNLRKEAEGLSYISLDYVHAQVMDFSQANYKNCMIVLNGIS